jgi:hypothetical protein
VYGTRDGEGHMSIFLPSSQPTVSRRRRRITLICVGVVAVLILGVKPVAAQFRKLQRQKLLAEAEAYFAQNRKTEALISAKKALATGDFSPRAHRLMLKLLEGKPDAVTFWMAMAGNAKATPEDRRELLKWAVAWGKADWAEAQWRYLQNERPMSVDTLRAGAALFELKGESGKAALFAQAVLEKISDDTDMRLLLGRVLLRDGSGRDVQIGRRLLLEQAERKDSAGLQALRILSLSRALNPFEAARCSDWLAENVQKTRLDLLTRAGLECQITPYKKASIIAQLAKEYSANAGDVVELARWLGRNECFDEIVNVIPLEAARRSADLFPLYVDALGSLGKWSDLEQILSLPELPVEALPLALYRARAAHELKQQRIEGLYWEQAHGMAGNDPRLLLRVGEYARRAGAMDQAEKAFQKLTRDSQYAAMGYLELLKIHEKDLRITHSLLRELQQKFPDDPAARNDLAYVSLLSGADIRDSIETAELLVKTMPNFLAYRTTLALGYLREGFPQKAKSLYQEQPVYWREVLPYQAAIYAAVLARTGSHDEASKIRREIPLEKLRAEEKQLLVSQTTLN